MRAVICVVCSSALAASVAFAQAEEEQAATPEIAEQEEAQEEPAPEATTNLDAPPPIEAPAPRRSRPRWVDGSVTATHFEATLISGLNAGFLLGTKLFVSPVREGYDGEAWIRLQGDLNATIGPYAPVFMTAAIVLNVPPLIFDFERADQPAYILTAVALALNLATVIVTAILNVPVNDVTMSADPLDPPANWRELRDQWELGHTIRSITSSLAF